LWQEVLQSARNRQQNNTVRLQNNENEHHKAEQLRLRILRLMANKGLGKAATELTSAGIHEYSDEVWKKVRELHPEVENVNADQWKQADNPWKGFDNNKPNVDKIRRIILGFPEGKAAGPSQLSPAHVKEAITCGSEVEVERLLNSLLRFVNICATGGLPPEIAKFFTAANMKPDNGVRPIACGEVLCRIVEQMLLNLTMPSATKYLCPVQVDVGKRDAAMNVIRLAEA
jgi:hypothetical protein